MTEQSQHPRAAYGSVVRFPGGESWTFVHKTVRRFGARSCAVLLAALSAVGLLLSAAPASAITSVPVTHCRFEAALVPGAGDVHQLQIQQAAAKVDNYLGRCQVASFVAGRAETYVGAKQHTIVVKGARWSIGRFRCTYQYGPGSHPDETVVRVRCQHTGRFASIVRFQAFI